MRPRGSNLVAYLLALAAVVGVGALLGAAPALALPEGRHYEMVSPPYKAGYGVSAIGAGAIEAVAPSGEAVAFGSIGAFAGAPAQHLFNAYLARRDPAKGWQTVSLDTPASKWPTAYDGVLDFSSTLESSLTFGKQAANRGAGEFDSSESELLLHSSNAPDTQEGFEVVGEALVTPSPQIAINYEGASPDLSHLILKPTPPVPLTPEGVGVTAPQSPYELVNHGGGAQSLHLIGVNNEAEPKSIAPSCNVDIGTEFGKQSRFGAIASDGQEVFFTEFTISAGKQCFEQLFVRLNDERTVEISRPLGPGPFGGCGDGGKPGEMPGEVPCQGAASRPSAEFVGASENGSQVFFTTTAPLDPATDKDTGNDLYMARIGCPQAQVECPVSEREVTSLLQVSHDSNAGEAAEVQGVVAVSPDGAHVYVVARGVLSAGLNAEGRAPVKGADNLYVYDISAEDPPAPAFIADLCSGPGLSGEAKDIRCPTDLENESEIRENEVNDKPLWTSVGPEAQTTGTGDFLVFFELWPAVGQ